MIESDFFNTSKFWITSPRWEKLRFIQVMIKKAFHSSFPAIRLYILFDCFLIETIFRYFGKSVPHSFISLYLVIFYAWLDLLILILYCITWHDFLSQGFAGTNCLMTNLLMSVTRLWILSLGRENWSSITMKEESILSQSSTLNSPYSYYFPFLN